MSRQAIHGGCRAECLMLRAMSYKQGCVHRTAIGYMTQVDREDSQFSVSLVSGVTGVRSSRKRGKCFFVAEK